MPRALEVLTAKLGAPLDNASLVFFRLGFGLLMLWNTVRYILDGRVVKYYVKPTFHFKYYGFEWVEPLTSSGMHALFLGMTVLCAFIAVGLFYRVSTALFFLAFTYTFLLEEARYLNHYYLVCLLSLLLVFMPANGALSVDALLWPRRRRRHTPAWTVWLLRAQLGIVYFFGGIAKLNWDWLRARPMAEWLAARPDTVPLIGVLFTQEWMGYVFAYGGLLFDLLVVWFLLWRKTRPYAFAVAVLFHLTNARLFQIGVFPWMMIAATTIFFEPDWPRRFLGLEPASATSAVVGRRPRWLFVLAIYLLIQVLLPLRHLLYPGVVSWTEEGHAFAWHMKLRDKEAKVTLVLRDPVDRRIVVIDPGQELVDWQYDKMAGRPDMILQYAHHVARREAQAAGHEVEVRARTSVSLNGRPHQPIIDPEVDLATQPRSLRPARWILPLDQGNQR